MATGCPIGVTSTLLIMTEQKPFIVKPWQFLTWRIAVMSKTAWTISRMSGHIRRSGKKSSKRDYDIANDETATTRRHDVGTWIRLARIRYGLWQEESCHHGFSYPSTPARLWTP